MKENVYKCHMLSEDYCEDVKDVYNWCKCWRSEVWIYLEHETYLEKIVSKALRSIGRTVALTVVCALFIGQKWYQNQLDNNDNKINRNFHFFKNLKDPWKDENLQP